MGIQGPEIAWFVYSGIRLGSAYTRGIRIERRVSVINKPLILAVVILLIALLAVGVWYHNNAEGGFATGKVAPDGLNQERDPAETEKGYHILLLYILPVSIMFGLILWRHKR